MLERNREEPPLYFTLLSPVKAALSIKHLHMGRREKNDVLSPDSKARMSVSRVRVWFKSVEVAHGSLLAPIFHLFLCQNLTPRRLNEASDRIISSAILTPGVNFITSRMVWGF